MQPRLTVYEIAKKRIVFGNEKDTQAGVFFSLTFNFHGRVNSLTKIFSIFFVKFGNNFLIPALAVAYAFGHTRQRCGRNVGFFDNLVISLVIE